MCVLDGLNLLHVQMWTYAYVCAMCMFALCILHILMSVCVCVRACSWIDRWCLNICVRTAFSICLCKHGVCLHCADACRRTVRVWSVRCKCLQMVDICWKIVCVTLVYVRMHMDARMRVCSVLVARVHKFVTML